MGPAQTSISAIAERAGVVLAFENNHALRMDLGFIHQLHDALDLVEKVGSPRLRVCAELNNAWIERFLYPDLARRSGLIGIVQVNDFAAGTLTTPQRVPPGDGIIPLRRILGALASGGYSGFLELELIGPGKRHQLRAGCAFLGHPLVGDTLYGEGSEGGVRLHAWRIELDGVIAEAPKPAWAR